MLRRSSTDAEHKLWLALRRNRLGVHFRRQQAINRYIVDFFCPSAKLIIELDGGQHAEMQKAYDDARTAWLNARGYRVLRFWNDDVLKNIDGVVEAIGTAVAATPLPNPPPQGGRE